MVKAWKISPGSSARAWPQCVDGKCILFGWRELGNHATFEDEKAILKALKRAYRPGEEGRGPRAANSICRFANKGRGKVVGVGVIESEYLPPKSPKNPSKHEWLRSARLVDWRITVPVTLDRFFFVRDTVWPLEPEQCEAIKRAYLKKNSGLKK